MSQTNNWHNAFHLPTLQIHLRDTLDSHGQIYIPLILRLCTRMWGFRRTHPAPGYPPPCPQLCQLLKVWCAHVWTVGPAHPSTIHTPRPTLGLGVHTPVVRDGLGAGGAAQHWKRAWLSGQGAPESPLGQGPLQPCPKGDADCSH